MIAILCLCLKRMRGLATFSLFHILLIVNLMLSVGITNGCLQIQSTSGACLKRNHAHGNVFSLRKQRLCHREWTINPAETTGMRNLNVNLKDRKHKMDGFSRLIRSKQKQYTTITRLMQE